jgi:hypothetical protein
LLPPSSGYTRRRESLKFYLWKEVLDEMCRTDGEERRIGGIFVGKLHGNTRNCRWKDNTVEEIVHEIVNWIETEEESETAGICEDSVS